MWMGYTILVTMIICMEYENYRGQAFQILGGSLIIYKGDSHWMDLVEKPYNSNAIDICWVIARTKIRAFSQQKIIMPIILIMAQVTFTQ